MKKKAIALLSGGLDSTLAVKIMIDMGIEVVALNFMSPFCTCTAKSAGCKSEAIKVAEEFGIKIKPVFMGQEYLDMVANPKFGYGKALNPCIDCRVLMFKRAKEIMEEEGASFMFTGEVLGQRPMSQRREAMDLVDKECGLEGILLRPLSAKLFEPTLPEKAGIVDREKLLEISGRSRKPQIALAEELGINDYPCPAGGCLLTETGFSVKMKDLMRGGQVPQLKEVKTLRTGRHFRVHENLKVIAGKDEKENRKLSNLSTDGDTLFEVVDFGGATILARGEVREEDIPLLAGMAVRYSSAPKSEDVKVAMRKAPGEELQYTHALAVSEELLEELRDRLQATDTVPA